MTKLTDLKEWIALKNHYKTIATEHMQDWFMADKERFNRFSLSLDDLLLDYSKNRILPETIDLLCFLAEKLNVSEAIEGLFTGKTLNYSEKRPALHTLLRQGNQQDFFLNGENISLVIENELQKIRIFTEKVRHHTWLGVSGKPIRTIVNIGMGGSHLGPLMAIHALSEYASPHFQYRAISNIDSAHLQETLKTLNPEETLFIVSSKSFTTLETITNAKTIRLWLAKRLGNLSIANHFVAITAAPSKALEFGLPKENIFTLWDWVGGRYSIWSAIGLPLAIMIGMDAFLDFLQGANCMDQHFKTADFSQNMPILMGLLSIWYINFFHTTHHAIVPYSHHLQYLRSHLQQLEMESNGKNISQQGLPIHFLTAPVILGEQGCNGQHAFHQLLHQGQHLIPVDFILSGNKHHELAHHHDILIGSGLSQAQALMRGKTFDEALAELQQEGFALKEATELAKHKIIPGNRPSNIIFMHQITPKNLGMLIALYEHKTFVQGVIWQINSFDQWGVELGKKLLPTILSDLTVKNPSHNLHDSSTQGLIDHYKQLKAKA